MEEIVREKEMQERKARMRRFTSYVSLSRDENDLLDEYEASSSEESPSQGTTSGLQI